MTGKPSICKGQMTEAIQAGENPDPVTGVFLAMGSSGSRLVLRFPRISAPILSTHSQEYHDANYRKGILSGCAIVKENGRPDGVWGNFVVEEIRKMNSRVSVLW